MTGDTMSGFNIDQILNTLKTDKGMQSAGLGGLAGLAAGMLMGGGAKKALGNVATIGAVAAVGGLAYKAWQSYQQSQGSRQLPAEPGDAFIPSGEADREELGKSMVRAMIAAAKADGNIDGAEKQRIFDKLGAMSLSPEDKAFVFDELGGPLDIDAVAARGDTPEHAAEIYAASLAAISVDSQAEHDYLAALAQRMRLPAGLVAEIHSHAGVEPPAISAGFARPGFAQGTGGSNI
jgi:uncharacterized membrane protein YebE (DUF533 family)